MFFSPRRRARPRTIEWVHGTQSTEYTAGIQAGNFRYVVASIHQFCNERGAIVAALQRLGQILLLFSVCSVIVLHIFRGFLPCPDLG